MLSLRGKSRPIFTWRAKSVPKDVCQKNPRTHKKNWHFHPRPFQESPTPPPLKGGILWAWGFSSRKNQAMPGAHKIGAANSGRKFYGHHAFSEFRVPSNSNPLWPRSRLARLNPLKVACCISLQSYSEYLQTFLDISPSNLPFGTSCVHQALQLFWPQTTQLASV